VSTVGIVPEPKQAMINGEPTTSFSMEVLLAIGVANREGLAGSKISPLTRGDGPKLPFSLFWVSFHTKTLHLM